MAAQKIKSSTQKFIEIRDIKEDVVLLANGSACIIIEVQATNFALLSQEEQVAKISSYAALLNSLSFPIQILIRNKKVDISSYVKLLELELGRSENEKVKTYIQNYRNFIQELIKVNTVLEKAFYIVVSYSPLEKGASDAKTSLHAKTDSLLNQLSRLSLRAKVLEQDALIRLFYEIYNQEIGDSEKLGESFGSPIVKLNETI